MKTFKLGHIQKLYFCSGARNHTLKTLFPNAKFHYELDERSASFKALGSCMAGELAAVCVTSGTAVSECLSAMVEAKYADIPLILISGDRPKRLHGTGAAQTIDHFGASSNIAGQQVEILSCDAEELEINNPKFPLHLNILVDKELDRPNTVTKNNLDDLKDFVNSHERTLFLFSHARESLRELVLTIKKKTDFVYAETLSWAKDLGPIANEFELLKLYKEGCFDSIVRIGHTPLSKLWRVIDTETIDVFSVDPRGLSALSHGQVCSDLDFVSLSQLEPAKCSHVSSFNEDIFTKYPDSQWSWFKGFQESIPEDSIIYLGNSSVIRDFEAVQNKKFRTYGNRGANGIDGQLSSAIGLANSLTEKVYCVLGDLTFLYDIGACMELPENLEVFILDNNGGRIFERVGINDETMLEGKKLNMNVPEQVHIVKISPEQTLECFRELMS
ncbi:MAG: hypothetical protein CME64_07565 [Halobacteriovoraceae bacterium]|nr:hypothetical protein [Halobacteriovoraceae bacterium]|tara:strand:- start:59916 stop:61247 length:1332 start_codon:yes stop_codon:yes gene_type:complete